MKSRKKAFVLTEIILAGLVVVMAYSMVWEKSGRTEEKISVLIQNPDDSRWNAFKYGLKMAAEDQKVEVSLVPMEKNPSVQVQRQALEQEIQRGADAAIIEPSWKEGVEEMLREMEKQIPVMLIAPETSKTEEKKEERKSRLPVTGPDDRVMGEELGKEILHDFNGKLAGKTIGIFCEDMKSTSGAERLEGLCEALENADGQIVWKDQSLEGHETVDVVAALDNTSLVRTGREGAMKNLHGALLYGIGNSTEAVYYLDTGIVECLIVPDDFYQGYQSLTAMAQALEHPLAEVEETVIHHRVLRSEDLFLEENQEILFTMSQ